MKVYITKYALTQGILTSYNAELCDDINPNMIKVSFTNDWHHNYFHKPNWHETYEEALEQANKIKTRKIEALKKQIKKIEQLSFVEE